MTQSNNDVMHLVCLLLFYHTSVAIVCNVNTVSCVAHLLWRVLMQAWAVEEKHRALNTMLGIKPFKSHVARRSLHTRSETVRTLYSESTPYVHISGRDTDGHSSELGESAPLLVGSLGVGSGSLPPSDGKSSEGDGSVEVPPEFRPPDFQPPLDAQVVEEEEAGHRSYRSSVGDRSGTVTIYTIDVVHMCKL